MYYCLLNNASKLIRKKKKENEKHTQQYSRIKLTIKRIDELSKKQQEIN